MTGNSFYTATTVEQQIENARVISFMMTVDRVVFARLISFFSFPTPGLKHKYCGPREIMALWESLTEAEKNEYRLFAMKLVF
jgi:hypothetical protein